ncbi:MAG: response regulator [Armatimonadetes bacterium]|nr:response regulator [Armatimonadota bacterium]
MNTLVDVRLLLIEDDLDFARVVKMCLSRGPDAAFEIEVAHNLVQAKACFDATACPCDGDSDTPLPRRFDVVVTDLCVPPHEGAETVRRVKEMAGPTPVVVLTSMVGHDVIAEIVAAGVDDFLGKEEIVGRAGIIRLERALRHAIKNGRLREEVARSKSYTLTLEAQVEMLHDALRQKSGFVSEGACEGRR